MKTVKTTRMKILHSTPAINLPSIMQHGLLAYPDPLKDRGHAEPDLIRPGVNLWRPDHRHWWSEKDPIKHYRDDPHVVLENRRDQTPTRTTEKHVEAWLPWGLVALFR